MKNRVVTKSLYTRELQSMIFSPISAVIVTLFLLALGWFFFMDFFLIGRADMRKFFGILPIILSVIIPAITMKSLSEEYSTGSYEMLATFPLTTLQILKGKFYAALTFEALMLFPTILYPILISTVGPLDWGPVIGGYLGSILLAASITSIGLFASSLTKKQVGAFMIAVMISLFLVLIGLDNVLNQVPSFLRSFMQSISSLSYFQNISKGIVDIRDLFYFTSVTIIFMYSTWIIIEKRK